MYVHRAEVDGNGREMRRKEVGEMDCKKAMELMTQFINEQLNTEDTEAFLNHIDSCPECREELEVTYSLMTAMKQLDADEDLSENYIEELNQKIETCYLDELKRKRSCARRRVVLAVVVSLLVLLNGITANEKREEEDRRFLRRITGIEESEITKENEVIATEEKGENGQNSECENEE